LEPGGENKSAAHAGGRLSPARSQPVSPPIKGWDRTSTPSTPSMMPHKPISGARRMPAGRRSGPNMTMAAAVSVLTRRHHSMFCAAEGRAMTMRAALLLRRFSHRPTPLPETLGRIVPTSFGLRICSDPIPQAPLQRQVHEVMLWPGRRGENQILRRPG